MNKISNTLKTSISGLNIETLKEKLDEFNFPAFKINVLHEWLYKKYINSFDEISSLSKKDREILENDFLFSSIKLNKKEISKDGTIKYLWELSDGNYIESVRMIMNDEKTYTVCISSQVGCAVGCVFCATGKLKLKRNLTSQEIVEQVLNIQRDTKERIDNIVYMGQGEPLHNYDEVVKSIKLIREDVGIGARHITVSTSGIPDKIKQLADEKIPFTLAISLHSPDQKTRELLVPIAKRYKMDELFEAIHYFYNKTKRRITIEYVMLNELNDSSNQAKALSDLTKGLHCHINLIPYNPIHHSFTADNKTINLERTPIKKIIAFREVLEKSSRKKATIRHERGLDINAACGQLANTANNLII